MLFTVVALDKHLLSVVETTHDRGGSYRPVNCSPGPGPAASINGRGMRTSSLLNTNASPLQLAINPFDQTFGHLGVAGKPDSTLRQSALAKQLAVCQEFKCHRSDSPRMGGDEKSPLIRLIWHNHGELSDSSAIEITPLTSTRQVVQVSLRSNSS